MDKQPKFISYDGRWPHLCCGTLTFSIGEEKYEWKDCLRSGGSTYFSNGYDDAHVENGPWVVSFPDDFPAILRPAITKMVNEHVPHGCCGGRL